MSLYLSAAFLAIFALNVALGSIDGPVFLSDVGEMMFLLAASAVFVVAIINKESSRKSNEDG